LEIIDNRALKIRTRNPAKFDILPQKFVQHIPGGAEVFVKWDLDHARVLKNLGFKNVPSPIERTYQWPGRYRPMAHQKTTAGFLTLHRRAFCFNEAGTSKTMSALWAADYLMSRGEVRRCLVVCPLSIMHSAWMGDINNSVIHRSAVVAHHTQASRRIEMIQGDYEFVIINYDGLKLVHNEIAADGRFDLVIVDEANAYASISTQRWKALAKILTPDTFLWMMTGTPAAQSPVNAYGLAKLVNPSAVPSFVGAWRDKVMTKITMFKWAPKPDAKDKVFSVLQPAIRYAKKDCMDLPPVLKTTREVDMTPQQKKYYERIKNDMLVMAAGVTISAVNKAAVVNKLLQISCIAYNTPVLTDAGWVPIQDVQRTHRIWDGAAFVRHEGLLPRGRKPVVVLDGVSMTRDHEVLTDEGWKTADDILLALAAGKRLDRADVRLPDSACTNRRVGGQEQKSTVVVPVCLRKRGGAGEPIPSRESTDAASKLWVSSRERNAPNVAGTPISNMARHAASLRGRIRQGLQKLWGAWDNGVSAVDRFFYRILDRHAERLLALADAGSQGRKQGVLQGKLPVGYAAGAGKQYAFQPHTGHAVGPNDPSASRADLWAEAGNAVCADKQVQMAGSGGTADTSGETYAETFDIHNCGPRSRFVVKGQNGELLLVHNCGAMYSEDGEVVEFDATPRMNLLLEILEETDRKVLIFAMYTSSIDGIAAFLTKHGHQTAVIDGRVSAGKRGEIINAFQYSEQVPHNLAPEAAEAVRAIRRDTSTGPRVLVMQPQATAHGITLTAADTVVFFGPLMSVELYLQAIARADRKGQTADKVTVIHIQSSPIEKKMFAAMEGRVSDHTLLSTMFDEELQGGKTL